jgi:hypothetical protein
MIKRIIALEKKCALAVARIEALEAGLNALTGGKYEDSPISMKEAREANECGDKETVRRFNEQFAKWQSGTSARVHKSAVQRRDRRRSLKAKLGQRLTKAERINNEKGARATWPGFLMVKNT